MSTGKHSEGARPVPRVVLLDTHFDSPETDASVERGLIEAVGGILEELDVYEEAEVCRAVAEADIVLFRSIRMTRKVFESMTRCRAIIRYGIGLDRVDHDAAREHGVAVYNIPDFCVEEMADHTLGLMIAAVRQLGFYTERARKGVGGVDLGRPIPRLSDLTFGTLGLGRIAQAVQRRASAFGMHCIAHDPFLEGDRWPLDFVQPVGMDELWKRSRVLSLHCPATPENRGMVNAERLSQLPPRAVLVNTARGELVNTGALEEALRSGHLAAAAVDVTDPEPLPVSHSIWECEGFLHTPHVGWYSEGSRRELQQKVGSKAAEVIRSLAEG